METRLEELQDLELESLDLERLSDLSSEDKVELYNVLSAKQEYKKHNKLKYTYLSYGPFKRSLYKKHIAFFNAGAQYNQRAMIAGNQTGKSFALCFEIACHLTGLYPDWWKGKRFDRAVDGWAAGYKNNIKEAFQEYLLGSFTDIGTGFIPKNVIKRVTRKPGIPDTVQDIYVSHVSGGASRITLKTYDEKAEAFASARLDFVALDEEPRDIQIYSESITRLVAKAGILMCSFTPKGITDLVLSFLNHGKVPNEGMGAWNDKYTVVISQVKDPSPHLTEDRKKELRKSYQPYELDSRIHGIPLYGAGRVYSVSEEDIVVSPFEIPYYWLRVYGFDPGWNKTAAVWGAVDPKTDVLYLYDEYYRGKAEPSIHADAIKARGSWMTGAADWAGIRDDGQKIIDHYLDFGLDLARADKSVEAGIQKVWQRISSGRLKVFSHMQNWLNEFRVYRRDENGKIVKEHDHLMDSTRYLVMTGLSFARQEPNEDEEELSKEQIQQGRNPVTGY